MTEADPTIIDSPLSGIVRKDGVTVEVSIFRLEDDHEWSLEVVNEANTSIVWGEVFETDAAAMRSFGTSSRPRNGDLPRGVERAVPQVASWTAIGPLVPVPGTGRSGASASRLAHTTVFDGLEALYEGFRFGEPPGQSAGGGADRLHLQL